MWTEGWLELNYESDPVIHPAQMVGRITGIEQVQFEPLQSHAFEIGLGKGNFRPIQLEGLWPVRIDELALD